MSEHAGPALSLADRLDEPMVPDGLPAGWVPVSYERKFSTPGHRYRGLGVVVHCLDHPAAPDGRPWSAAYYYGADRHQVPEWHPTAEAAIEAVEVYVHAAEESR